MLVTPPFGASSNIALWRAYSKPPVELVVADLEKHLKKNSKKNLETNVVIAGVNNILNIIILCLSYLAVQIKLVILFLFAQAVINAYITQAL